MIALLSQKDFDAAALMVLDAYKETNLAGAKSALEELLPGSNARELALLIKRGRELMFVAKDEL